MKDHYRALSPENIAVNALSLWSLIKDCLKEIRSVLVSVVQALKKLLAQSPEENSLEQC